MIYLEGGMKWVYLTGSWAMEQKEYVSKKSGLNGEVRSCESRLNKAEKQLSFLGDVISIKR